MSIFVGKGLVSDRINIPGLGDIVVHSSKCPHKQLFKKISYLKIGLSNQNNIFHLYSIFNFLLYMKLGDSGNSFLNISVMYINA